MQKGGASIVVQIYYRCSITFDVDKCNALYIVDHECSIVCNVNRCNATYEVDKKNLFHNLHRSPLCTYLVSPDSNTNFSRFIHITSSHLHTFPH